MRVPSGLTTAVLVGGLAFAGCGGGGDGSATTASGPPATTVAPPATTPDAAGTATAGGSTTGTGGATTAGSAASTGTGSAPGTTTGTAAATSSQPHSGEPSSGDRADRKAAEAIVMRYVHALAGRHYAAICATRVPAEKRQFARLAGSCEKAFRAIAQKEQVQQFAGARAGNVRIRGRLAGVDVLLPGQSTPQLTVAARRTGGRWLAVDIPDSRVP